MKSQGKPMNIQNAAPAASDPTAEAMGIMGGASGMVRTQVGYQTAVHVTKPRDLDRIRKSVTQEAVFTRDDFYYSMTFRDKNSDSGKSLVEGPSIDGAMILLRNWGNAVCEPEVVEESMSHWVFKATFIDLETGFTSARLFRQRKSESHSKFDNERALDIAFQIGQSKAIRNTVIRSLPQWLISEGMEAARSAAEGQMKDLDASAAKAIETYGKLSPPISLAQLERKLGKNRVDWIPADVVLLRAIFRAIKDGQTSANQEFSEDEPAPAAAERGPVVGEEPKQVIVSVSPEGVVQTAPAPVAEPVDATPEGDLGAATPSPLPEVPSGAPAGMTPQDIADAEAIERGEKPKGKGK